MSPTRLTIKRGLRRPMPVKSLSCSQSSQSGTGSFSVSSRATSRRSRSIVSTPHDQLLFDNLTASLAISLSSRNKLDRFQLKKNMAMSSRSSKRMLLRHPSRKSNIKGSDSKKPDVAERFFSIGGALAIDKPGKVTPTIYTVSSASDQGEDCAADTSYSYDSDESAFVRDSTLATKGYRKPSRRFTRSRVSKNSNDQLMLNQLFADEAVSYGDNEDDGNSSVNLSTIGDDTNYSKSTRSRTSTLKSIFGDDADDECTSVNLSSVGGQTLSSHFLTTRDDSTCWDRESVTSTLSKSVRSQASTLKSILADDEESFVNVSTIGDTSYTTGADLAATFTTAGDLDESTVGQDQDESTLGQETTSMGFASTMAYVLATLETGEASSTTCDRSTEVQTLEATSSRTSGQSSSIENSTSQSSASTSENTSGTETTTNRDCSLSQVIVRSAETKNGGGISTAFSVETLSGVVRKGSLSKGEEEKEEQTSNGCSEDDPQNLRRSSSDLSDITTLSVAQQRLHPAPMMNYSNLFSSAGSGSGWSTNINLKRDDQLFMSRAQTLLEFFEPRVNADGTEIILSPDDKDGLDKKFNASTRLRFIDSLRMRCVVKSETTMKTVRRCCRLGLDREGAENPIFAARALGEKSISVKLPPRDTLAKSAADKQEQSANRTNETESLTISQLSLHSSEWEPVLRKGVKKGHPKILQPDCSVEMCGFSFLVCVREEE